METFAARLNRQGFELRHTTPQVLQINTGKLCNLACVHCHVNAGPGRSELMTRETVDRVLDWLEKTAIPTVDITGGAPEMCSEFRHLVTRVKAMSPARHVIDRCNLTILLEPGYEWLPEFLAGHRVEIIASLPCYSPGNVDAQRGDGVFDASIKALLLLNALGYGKDPSLPLHLVYNPVGASLPGPQPELQADYKRELGEQFGIVFNNLYTITNMPVERFSSFLRRHGAGEEYRRLLHDAFNPHTLEGLMCRSTINVGWTGEVYDCDFNQMLKMPWRGDGHPLRLWEIDPSAVEHRPVLTGSHCFGCTAGAGSSCGGALV